MIECDQKVGIISTCAFNFVPQGRAIRMDSRHVIGESMRTGEVLGRGVFSPSMSVLGEVSIEHPIELVRDGPQKLFGRYVFRPEVNQRLHSIAARGAPTRRSNASEPPDILYSKGRATILDAVKLSPPNLRYRGLMSSAAVNEALVCVNLARPADQTLPPVNPKMLDGGIKVEAVQCSLLDSLLRYLRSNVTAFEHHTFGSEDDPYDLSRLDFPVAMQ